MAEKQYISRVKFVDGTVYNVKDIEAREMIESLFTDELIIDCGGVPDESLIDEETILDCGGAPIDEEV